MGSFVEYSQLPTRIRYLWGVVAVNEAHRPPACETLERARAVLSPDLFDIGYAIFRPVARSFMVSTCLLASHPIAHSSSDCIIWSIVIISPHALTGRAKDPDL